MGAMGFQITSLSRLIRPRSKKTPKLRANGLCAGNSPATGEFPAQMASNAEYVFIWWRHHGKFMFDILCNVFQSISAVRMIHLFDKICSSDILLNNIIKQWYQYIPPLFCQLVLCLLCVCVVRSSWFPQTAFEKSQWFFQWYFKTKS